MGLFNLFGKNEKKAAAGEERREERENVLAPYAGMRVEVTNEAGVVLFVAKLMYIRGNSAELHQYSESELSKRAEGEEAEPIPVKIRGYNDKERKAVYLEGAITPQPRHIWRVEELVLVKLENDRAFFRLDTDLEASITLFSGLNAGELPCRLLNISVGGACVGTDRVLHQHDKFLLKVRLLEDRPVSAMFCQVLRITEREEKGFEYGCRFLELTEEDQDRIAQSIFTAQRKNRNRG